MDEGLKEVLKAPEIVTLGCMIGACALLSIGVHYENKFENDKEEAAQQRMKNELSHTQMTLIKMDQERTKNVEVTTYYFQDKKNLNQQYVLQKPQQDNLDDKTSLVGQTMDATAWVKKLDASFSGFNNQYVSSQVPSGGFQYRLQHTR